TVALRRSILIISSTLPPAHRPTLFPYTTLFRSKKGCRFSPTIHLGNTYQATWICSARGGVVAMSQKLTVTSESSYEDISEARFEEQQTRTKIVATRIGECPLLPNAPKHRRGPSPLPRSGNG